MNKKQARISLIFAIVIGILWTLVFCANLFYPPEKTFIIIINGICAVMCVINVIVQWIYYKKNTSKQ